MVYWFEKLFHRLESEGDAELYTLSELHEKMIATGHVHYAKSVCLYLQLMQELPNDHPWLYQCFIEQGFHTVRRGNRYWAGLWTDLTIEQVLM